MEYVKQGEAICSKTENGERDILDLPYSDISLAMIFLAYELGSRKMCELIYKLFYENTDNDQ